MIASLLILIIEALLFSGSGSDSSTFETPRPGLERLSGQGKTPRKTPLEEADYRVDSAARSTVAFLLPNGPRTLQSLEIVPTAATRTAWKSARLRLLWDTDAPEEAGLDIPFQLAFGGLGDSETTWLNRLPMPYRSTAMLVIDTESPISGRIRVEMSAGVELDAGYLRGKVIGETPLEESGHGRLAAIVASEPYSSKLIVDGKDRGPVESFIVARSDVGRTSPRGRVSWFSDPISFQSSFRLEGEVNAGSGSALFWYSDRPSSGRSEREKQP